MKTDEVSEVIDAINALEPDTYGSVSLVLEELSA